MKKILLSVLLIVAMLVNVIALTGCFGGGGDGDGDGTGNGDTQQTPPEQYNVQAYDGSPVTITFYHTMGAMLQNVLNLALEDFNAMYPNIKVEHQSLGDYDGLRNQINTELGGGKQPNIAYCYPDHVAIYKDLQGVLPLDAFINSTLTVTKADGTTEIMGLTKEQQADFVTTYWNEGKVFDSFGTMYTLPMAKSTEALYYNKTFFDNFEDEQGKLSVPTTWEEMESVCRRIKAKYPDSIPLGYDSESNWFITRLAQLGADYTSIDPNNHYVFNNLTAVDILEEAHEWYKDGLVKTEKTNGSYTSDLFTLPLDTSVDKAFMVVGSTGGASYQAADKIDDEAIFEVDIAPLPQANTAAPKTISQGPSLCLFKDSNPQEVAASWLLIKFLTTDILFQARFSMQSGYAPVIGAAKKNDVYKNWLETSTELPALAVKSTISQEHAYFTSPAFNGSSKARTEAENVMYNVMTYTGTDVRAKAGDELGKALANCKKAGG